MMAEEEKERGRERGMIEGTKRGREGEANTL